MKLTKAVYLSAVAILTIAATGILFAQEVAVHISQSEALRAAKERPQPDYPAMARQLHLEGEVQIQAHINESGSVEEAKPLTGNAVLATAAVNATRRWKFSPFMTDGKPRKAVTELSFNFKL